MKNRDQILNMLAKVDDQFSLSIYKKAYEIDDLESAFKRDKIKFKQNDDSVDRE